MRVRAGGRRRQRRRRRQIIMVKLTTTIGSVSLCFAVPRSGFTAKSVRVRATTSDSPVRGCRGIERSTHPLQPLKTKRKKLQLKQNSLNILERISNDINSFRSRPVDFSRYPYVYFIFTFYPLLLFFSVGLLRRFTWADP